MKRTMQAATNTNFQLHLEQISRDDIWKLLNWLQRVDVSFSFYPGEHENVTKLFSTELELAVEQLRLDFLVMLTGALQRKIIAEIQAKQDSLDIALEDLNGNDATS